MSPRPASNMAAREKAARKRDAVLHEALKETFPASDPIAVGAPTGTEPPRAPIDRKPPRSFANAPASRRRGKGTKTIPA